MGVLERGRRSSLNKEWIEINSKGASATALYSTSVLDLETVCCLLVLHEMRILPRYIR